MDKQKRQDVIIRICCLVAAIGLWMYVRSSEDPVITSTLKYVPVQVLNADTLSEKGLVLIDKPEEFYINISVKAASSLVRDLDKNKDFKLVVDLQGYGLIPGENKVPVEIKQSPTGVTVSNADALNIKIDVDNLIEKDIPIVANIQGKVSEGYYSNEPIINPSTIKVSGPQQYVDEIVKGEVQLDLTYATENINKSLRVKLVNEKENIVQGVIVNQEYVQVTVNVNKGKNLKINVRTVGTAPQNVFVESIASIPNSIEVIGESDIIDGLTYINTGDIDLSKITESTTLEVPLIIPENVSVANGEGNVQVKIVITKYKEKTISLPINYLNLGEEFSLENKIETVDIVITGTEEVIEKFKVENLKATVDLGGVLEGEHSLQVDVTGVPENVQLKSITPDKAAIVIKKTNEETGNDDNQG